MESFPEDYYRDLNQFAGAVWGNSKAVLRKHEPDGFEYIDLGEYFDAFQCLFLGIVTHDKILVTKEYRLALEAMRTLPNKSIMIGAYIEGQRGIGKTLFLIYFLIHALGQKEAVALQIGPDIYAFFKDTVTLSSFAYRSVLSECSWGLCDSNQYERRPPKSFLSESGPDRRMRVIQTTPPERVSLCKGWPKRYHCERYVMDIWADEEIAHLAILLRLDVQRMTTRAKKWGNIPRTLLRQYDDEDGEVEAHHRRAAQQAIVRLRRSAILDKSPWKQSPLFILRPESNSKHPRTLARFSVPTRTLRRVLAEALRGEDGQTKWAFYRFLLRSPFMRQMAGFIGESWFHSFLVDGYQIECKWLAKDSGEGGAALPATLRLPRTHVPILTSWDAPIPQAPPFYWIAPSKNFPGIQSALVLETGIFAFRLDIRSDDTPPINGLRMLRERLLECVQARGLPWSVLFIGEEMYDVERAAHKWSSKVVFPTEAEGVAVAVGYSKVDPVQEDVAFRVYHDESDPVPQELMKI